MKVLIIDNYDSFTYNIVQALGAMGHEVAVHRNDRITPTRSPRPNRIGSSFRPAPARRRRPASPAPSSSA